MNNQNTTNNKYTSYKLPNFWEIYEISKIDALDKLDKLPELKENHYKIDNNNAIILLYDGMNYDEFRDRFRNLTGTIIVKGKAYDGFTFEYFMCHTLDLSQLDTSEMTTMKRMFYNCQNLNFVNVSNFDTSKVTDMTEMFYNCASLNQLDLRSFNTKYVTDMHAMFKGAHVDYLDLNTFNTTKVQFMNSMFELFTGKQLFLDSFVTTSMLNISRMFYDCNTELITMRQFQYHDKLCYNFFSIHRKGKLIGTIEQYVCK